MVLNPKPFSLIPHKYAFKGTDKFMQIQPRRMVPTELNSSETPPKHLPNTPCSPARSAPAAGPPPPQQGPAHAQNPEMGAAGHHCPIQDFSAHTNRPFPTCPVSPAVQDWILVQVISAFCNGMAGQPQDAETGRCPRECNRACSYRVRRHFCPSLPHQNTSAPIPGVGSYIAHHWWMTSSAYFSFLAQRSASNVSVYKC